MSTRLREVGERSETDGSSPDLGLTDMGGRVYDPLAGRFTTADPIIQAPFALTQGQNRYAYVFNDPINLTDPSGFSTTDAGTPSSVTAGLAPAEIGAAIVGGAYIATHGFSASLPGIGNIATTFLMNIGGGSAGGTFTAPAPTAAPTANPNHPDAMSGVGNASGGGSPLDGPTASDKADQIKRQLDEMPDNRNACPQCQYWQDVRNDPNASPAEREMAERGMREMAKAGLLQLLFEGAGRVLGAAVEWLLPARAAAGAAAEGAAIKTTAHGAERIAGAAATRGGVLSEAGVAAVRQGGRVMTQADGATVRILQNAGGRFNVVVEGERGIITTFENLSQKSLDRLGRNYGWH